MSKIKKTTRILAIDPGTRYLGIAVFENKELIYWAVKTLSTKGKSASSEENKKKSQILCQEVRKVITDLIGFYQPDVVMQEKAFFVQSRSSEQLKKISETIKNLVKKKELIYAEYAPTTVRTHICQNGRATKKETAKIIVSIYPELKVNLTQCKLWQENYWEHMFDAVALGMCYNEIM